MPRCPSCSRDCAPDSRFCPGCATPLDATSAETAILGVPPSSVPSLSSSSAVDEGRFLPGTVLAARYRIAGLLGRGGMGEVYRATDLTLGQVVALKFLPEAAARDERALARFYNEIRIARQVTHPNVCRVYDIGQVEGLHYISMEYVDGEDLSVLLRRIGRLPVDKAVEIARKLCAGLAAAHEKGVLHRDLKPANVMIDGRGQVVIMDFGLAGLSDQLQGDIRSGTPAYMSPEQLAGTEVTSKSDIYALGLLLYEIFAGKRAFDASSLLQLTEMQQRGVPVSLTSLVKETDPAVERVIMRCLSPDPKLRPPTPLAVAAALPGGDPLAAALAAGETPSPDMVAAAGETEGLRPVVALSCLAVVVALSLACAFLGARHSITSQQPLDIPPAALARDARQLLRSFGYTARPHDTAWSFEANTAYRDYLRQHPTEAAARWRNPAAGQPPLIRFWYRESSRDLVGEAGLNSEPRFSDPPFDISGMTRLQMDTEGRLQRLEAIPPQVEPPPATAAPPFDWNRLFSAAGLDAAQFQPADAQWTPLANWDSRAAWTGADPVSRAPLRVEAASWRGKPVFFRIIGPWTTPERMQESSSGDNILVLAVLYPALLVAAVIAWYNHRKGRGDRRGAFHLTALYFVCMFASKMVSAPHVTSPEELDTFWRAVGVAGINGALIWVLYLALEPWVRRRWPHSVISWTRYTAKGIHDPLVGRDLLFGAGFGAVWALGAWLEILSHGSGGEPMFVAVETLNSFRTVAGPLIATVSFGIFDCLFFFFLFFVLRVVLRREWLAVVAFALLLGLVFSGSSAHWGDRSIDTALGVVMAVAFVRIGLMGVFVGDAVHLVLINVPWTLDSSAWYFGLTLLGMVVVLAVAAYGLRTSLAGRPLFKEDWL